MMFRRHMLSLRGKLIGIILSVTLGSLIAGFAFIMLQDVRVFKREMRESTELLARVIGDYSSYDLIFNIRSESQKRLNGLKDISLIEQALITDALGRPFSSFSRSGIPPRVPGPASGAFPDDLLRVEHPIHYKGERVGTLYLTASAQPLRDKVRQYHITMSSVLGALLLVSLFAALRLQKKITRPLVNLTAAARRITEEEDYSVRAAKTSNDEIGVLCDAFNRMLGRLEERQRERDAAEGALKKSEARFRHIIEQSNDAMYVLKNERFVFINPRFEQYFGYGQAETIAPEFNFIHLVAPQDRDFIRERAAGRERGEPLPPRYTFWGQSKTGRQYCFEVSLSSIEWDGAPAVLGALRDVTERKNAEARLQKQQEELALYARQLERSNRELDQFAYVTSHDLKAPLRAIANLSLWIEEDLQDKLGDETRRHLDLLRGRVARMEGLINGILEYSRIGRIRQAHETVDVRALLGEVLDLLDPPKGFTIRLPERLPVLACERVRLHQVFFNLIGNAVKHHDKGGGTIVVEAQEEGDFYRFTVSDDGPGIAPEYHEKVFEIFQTLVARDKMESTGIGLTLVKKIVEDQGGNILLESSEGQGTRIQFLWPQTPQPRPAPRAEGGPTHEGRTPP